MRSGLVASLLLSSVGAMAAAEVIFIDDFELGDSSAWSVVVGEGCEWADPDSCPQGHYCAAAGCAIGTCAPIGQSSDTTKQPVCGCDGVNYWNATTAAGFGMAVATPGACSGPRICGGFAGVPCPDPFHNCSYLFDNQVLCNLADPAGICWGMPATCAPDPSGATWRRCSNPSGACSSECLAISDGGPFFEDPSCPQ